ncbi:Deoxycytidine monophosphate (dCMP) deaminase, partial [Ascosphaera pollenicola]
MDLLDIDLIFAINQFPFLHGLMLYGARAVEDDQHKNKKRPDNDAVKPSSSSFISRLTSFSVPHTYFTHFYLFSCLSSLLWAHQLYTRGPLFLALARLAQRTGKHVTLDAAASMTPTQLILCWLAMACQGARRTAECIAYFKPSASRMWIVFYVVGVAFYLLVNIAIWVEGV